MAKKKKDRRSLLTNTSEKEKANLLQRMNDDRDWEDKLFTPTALCGGGVVTLPHLVFFHLVFLNTRYVPVRPSFYIQKRHHL